MLEYTDKIKKVAKKLLEKETVDVFIGYKKGSIPMMNEPVLINDPEKTDHLYWDSNCRLNLCNYLTGRTDRIGIVANGCNSRNIVTHIIENQIKREQLYIVGIPCTGMIDHRAVKKAISFREILDVTENKGQFTVKCEGFEETFDKKDYLQSNCAVCLHRNPVEYDEMVAERVEEQQGTEPYKDVEKIEKMGSEEKWEFFMKISVE